MLLILVALFMLFVGVLKPPVQSILVQNLQEKDGRGYKSSCVLTRGEALQMACEPCCLLTELLFATGFLSTGSFEEQVLHSPAAVSRDPGSS